MFKPNFKYTNNIVNNLTKINVAREIILNSPLIPLWEITLRKETIIRSAHSSTSIEGNRLTLDEVSDLANGREVMATRKDKQEVLNYIKVLETIGSLMDGNKITDKDILRIHKILTKGTLENPSDVGIYRTRYVVVANRLTGEVKFRPPENKDVPRLINELLEWINSEQAKELDPVLQAGIVHYEFVRIHPFIDGNGRTARVLASLILFLRGFDIKQFFCLDDYYDSDRPAYYKVLQSVNQTTLDISEWLEYFVEGVRSSIFAVHEKVIRLSSERLRTTKKGQVALSERQMKIVEWIVNNQRITIKDIGIMFKISRQAALKEVGKLIKLKVLKLQGIGRSSYYILS